MNEKNTPKPSQTDWARIDALSDDQIDTGDIPPLDESFFRKARWRMPQHAVTTVSVEVDSDVLAWYQAQGGDYASRMSAALRIYAAAHQA